MFHIGRYLGRSCEGLTRREMLQVGGLGLAGMTLADWFRCREAQASPGAGGQRDVSCIFLWLDGGPSHLETFDPKPEAPSAIRGPFKSIETAVPGLRFSETLPLLAQRASRLAVIRSLHHDAAAIHETGQQLLLGAYSALSRTVSQGLVELVTQHQHQ